MSHDYKRFHKKSDDVKERSKMAKRRSNVYKFEAWSNDAAGDDEDSRWIAASPDADEPILASRPWAALAALAGRWGQKTACLGSPYSVRQCERYTYSVMWDEATKKFVATVSEFPHLSRSGSNQLLALCNLLLDVRHHVQDLEGARAVIGGKSGMPLPDRIRPGSAPIPGPGGNPLSDPEPPENENVVDLSSWR